MLSVGVGFGTFFYSVCSDPLPLLLSTPAFGPWEPYERTCLRVPGTSSLSGTEAVVRVAGCGLSVERVFEAESRHHAHSWEQLPSEPAVPGGGLSVNRVGLTLAAWNAME